MTRSTSGTSREVGDVAGERVRPSDRSWRRRWPPRLGRSPPHRRGEAALVEETPGQPPTAGEQVEHREARGERKARDERACLRVAVPPASDGERNGEVHEVVRRGPRHRPGEVCGDGPASGIGTALPICRAIAVFEPTQRWLVREPLDQRRLEVGQSAVFGRVQVPTLLGLEELGADGHRGLVPGAAGPSRPPSRSCACASTADRRWSGMSKRLPAGGIDADTRHGRRRVGPADVELPSREGARRHVRPPTTVQRPGARFGHHPRRTLSRTRRQR